MIIFFVIKSLISMKLPDLNGSDLFYRIHFLILSTISLKIKYSFSIF